MHWRTDVPQRKHGKIRSYDELEDLLFGADDSTGDFDDLDFGDDDDISLDDLDEIADDDDDIFSGTTVYGVSMDKSASAAPQISNRQQHDTQVSSGIDSTPTPVSRRDVPQQRSTTKSAVSQTPPSANPSNEFLSVEMPDRKRKRNRSVVDASAQRQVNRDSIPNERITQQRDTQRRDTHNDVDVDDLFSVYDDASSTGTIEDTRQELSDTSVSVQKKTPHGTDTPDEAQQNASDDQRKDRRQKRKSVSQTVLIPDIDAASAIEIDDAVATESDDYDDQPTQDRHASPVTDDMFDDADELDEPDDDIVDGSEDLTDKSDSDNDATDEDDYEDDTQYSSDASDEDEQLPEFVRKHADFYENYEYVDFPTVPMQFRGADIIGLRTRATGKTDERIGPIQPKGVLRKLWDDLTDVNKYILMLISEHRHLTINQLQTLIVLPTQIRTANSKKMKEARKDPRTEEIPIHNTMKAYFTYVTEEKYQCPLDYKTCHKTATIRGLKTLIKSLCELRYIEEITPSYEVRVSAKKVSKEYKAHPSLFTQHYYLTPLGARLLICNTNATTSTGKNPVGFVPTYKDAAYMSIVHETECSECFCSIIACSEYASNMELWNPNADDKRDYGFFDICRFYHEKDVEYRFKDGKGSKVVFKSDGEMTIYSSKLGDFIDYFLEYDAGSSKAGNIKHKIESFAKYVLYLKRTYGPRARRPVLLLVTQKPSSFMPQINGKSTGTVYTNGIKTMMRSSFKGMEGVINDIACVLVCDCNALRQHGAMGACWHRMDLRTGRASDRAMDLVEASRDVVEHPSVDLASVSDSGQTEAKN